MTIKKEVIKKFLEDFSYRRSSISAFFGTKNDERLANRKYDIYKKMLAQLELLIQTNQGDFKAIVLEAALASFEARKSFQKINETLVSPVNLTNDEIIKLFPEAASNTSVLEKARADHGSHNIIIYREHSEATPPCSFERSLIKAIKLFKTRVEPADYFTKEEITTLNKHIQSLDRTFSGNIRHVADDHNATDTTLLITTMATTIAIDACCLNF